MNASPAHIQISELHTSPTNQLCTMSHDILSLNLHVKIYTLEKVL